MNKEFKIKPSEKGFSIWYGDTWILDASEFKEHERIYINKEYFELEDEEVTTLIYRFKKD